jgi:hypothetical protein
MSKKPAFIVIFLGCASAYLLYMDRVSTLSLHLVEVEQQIGLPLPGILLLIGFAWLGLAWRNSTLVNPTQTKRTSSSTKSGHTDATARVFITAEGGTPEWGLQIQASAKSIKLPVGARMELNLDNKFPIILTLEQAPNERCKRAITQVAKWLSNIPTPPRLKIIFNHCPEGGSPRHHQVSGAFAQSHDRAHFKVVRHLNEVDILFSHPNPQWTQ